jgi:UDP-N-acetyl-2-amino-2-deoxyglucuronate dehydrogenase
VTSPLRFGIVGAGVIAGTHAAAIASLSDARLEAVADCHLDHARRLAAQYSADSYGSLTAMLADADLDIVTVCTPSGMHAEHVIAAMRSGRHVIVEKPMDITLKAIDEMLRVQAETGVKLAVISQHRWDPATRRLYDLIQDGALGRLVLGNAHVLWWRAQEYYDSGAWRGTWALDGGGVLMNQSIHSIDLLQWLLGPVASVRAYADTLAHCMETEDTAVAALRFRSGALGTIAATTSAYPGVAARIEVFGDRGSAIIENDRLSQLSLGRDGREEPPPYGLTIGTHDPRLDRSEAAARNAAGVSATTHAAQIDDMVRAVRDNGTPLVDGRAGKHPVEIIIGIYESARTGREVALL